MSDKTPNGKTLYGEVVTDILGNEAVLHEAGVDPDEGGPFAWLSLRKPGEDGAAAVLLDTEKIDSLIKQLQVARKAIG